MAKFLFYVWGIGGLMLNIVSTLNLLMPTSIGVGTSAWASALTLVWIGGMIFFAAAHLMAAPKPPALPEVS